MIRAAVALALVVTLNLGVQAAPVAAVAAPASPAVSTCANPGPVTVQESAACDLAAQADRGRAEMLLGLALLILLTAATLGVTLWR